jgi:hypothetical protein
MTPLAQGIPGNRRQPQVKSVARCMQHRQSARQALTPAATFLPLKWQQAAMFTGIVRDMSLPPDSTARAALAAGFCFRFALAADHSTPPPPAQQFEGAGDLAKAREAYILAADGYLRCGCSCENIRLLAPGYRRLLQG